MGNREQADLFNLLLRVADEVGGSGLQREVATMLSVAETSGSITAVVGYVKRGKSTLVNQILGRDLSPTGPLPETASAIAYRRSAKTKASGVTFELARRKLAGRESRFRKACSRGAAKDLVLVQFDGDVDLADGVTIVDTAGAGESSDSVRSLAVSGTSEALLDVVDSAVVVVGCPPGPEAAELNFLRRVVQIVGAERVRLVIKALDSSVDRAQLIEWRDYLSEFADIAPIASKAYLVSDGDLQDIARLKQWLQDLESVHVQRHATIDRAQIQILGAIGHLNESVELDITDAELSTLQPSLASALRPRTKSERLRVAQAELDAEYEQARRTYEENHRVWLAEYTPLRNAHTAKQNEIGGFERQRSEASSSRVVGNLGAGCAGIFLVPLSFLAFPIGPIVVIGLLVLNVSSRKWNYDSAAEKIGEQIAYAEPELARLTRQLELLDSRKPVPPVPPPRLVGELREPSRGYRQPVIRAAVALVVLLVAGGAIVLSRTDRATSPVDSIATSPLTQPSSSSIEPGAVAPPTGLVVATMGSGASPDVVRSVQDLLRVACCSDVVVDGVWGAQTQAAVEQLREKIGLPLDGGIDGLVWDALLERSFPGPLGASTRETAAPGIVVPAELYLNSDNQVPGVGRVQHFVFPFAPGSKLETWLGTGGARSPEGEWVRCRSAPSIGRYVAEWVSDDGSLIQLVIGDADVGWEEARLTIWDRPVNLTGSCAMNSPPESSAPETTATTTEGTTTSTSVSTSVSESSSPATTATTVEGGTPTTTSPANEPEPTTTTTDLASPEQLGIAPVVEAYLSGLVMWSSEGTNWMIENSSPSSPARAYAEHLAQGFRAGAAGNPIVTVSEVADGAVSLCIGSSCFVLSSFESQEGSLYSFDVDGEPLRESVKYWKPDGDAPRSCWVDGDPVCPGRQAVLIEIRTLFATGSTLYMSLDSTVGPDVSGLGSAPSFVMVTPHEGSPVQISLPAGSTELRPGARATWVASVSGLGVDDVARITIGIRWDDLVYDWEIEVPRTGGE